jgi:hypothetical protein
MAEKQPESAARKDSFRFAFILTEQALSSLNEIIRSFTEDKPYLKFRLGCSDGTERTYSSVSDVKKYDNPKSRDREDRHLRQIGRPQA